MSKKCKVTAAFNNLVEALQEKGKTDPQEVQELIKTAQGRLETERQKLTEDSLLIS